MDPAPSFSPHSLSCSSGHLLSSSSMLLTAFQNSMLPKQASYQHLLPKPYQTKPTFSHSVPSVAPVSILVKRSRLKQKAGNDPNPAWFHTPAHSPTAYNPGLAKPLHTVCQYLPALTPDPSAICPHVSAKDWLHCRTPGILATTNSPYHTTLASASEAEKACIRDTMLASWDDLTYITYGAGLLVFHIFCDC